MLSWFRAEHPNAENHWTEGSILPIDLRSAAEWNNPSMGRLAEGFLQCIAHGVQSITVWNLALDEQGHPNIGPFDCRGTFTVSRDGQTAVPSAEYHTLLHFTKFIKRGAKRVVLDKNALPRNFAVEGFENPDGQMVLVVSNTEGSDSEFNLLLGGQCVPLRVLRQSVSTVLL
jgi:glucosylceramidase